MSQSFSTPPSQPGTNAPHASQHDGTLQECPAMTQPPMRPDSPVNRKRAEGKDEEGSTASEDVPASQSTFPPLKKTKTSTLPSQASMTDYRSSYEINDDILSPQTSPTIDPTSSSLPFFVDRRPSPPKGIATLSRSRTHEEFQPNTPTLTRNASSIYQSMSASKPSIRNLNLGEPSERTRTGERAMGVITSRPTSRQASPAVVMKSRETTPIVIVDPLLDHTDVHMTPSQSQSNLDDSADEEESRRALLDTSVEYDEDEDHDYDFDHAADTTVDESFNRVETSDSESESDSDISSMDEFDCEPRGPPYLDRDLLCLDRLSEEEEERIVEEAREHGIGYIIQEYIMTRIYTVKKLLLMTFPGPIDIPTDCTENDLIRLLSDRLERILRRRKRLEHIHSLQNVIDLLKTSKNIMVLTGAGVSVSCGIPDFRSPDGIYSRLSEFQLKDPQQMFDLEFFQERPEIFYSFAREIFPSNFVPSPSHYFIKLLEDQGRLLRNYTQNIDTLEQQAGIHNVLQCHGSFATASCVRCRHQVKGVEIKDSIFKQEVAYCKVCQVSSPPPLVKKPSSQRHSSSDDSEDDEDSRPALMKPDIVFFGERLPAQFDDSLIEDRAKVDLLIVIGSSLKVAPVSDIMHQLPTHIPQILINRTPITHMEFDVQLLGNCDTIVAELCRLAGWELRHPKLPGGTSNVPDMASNTNLDGSGRGGRAHWSLVEPNTYLFEGAILEDITYDSSQNHSRSFDHLNGHGILEDGSGSDGDTEDNSSQRRDSIRSGRRVSTGLMDTDSEPDQDPGFEGFVQPASLLPNGITTGTTEPQSGSIGDLGQHVPTEGGDSDLKDKVRSVEEDEEEIKIRVMFTEKMPRDLGEDEVRSSSEAMYCQGSCAEGDESFGEGFERRLSAADLACIVEDPLLKEEEEL